LIASFIYGVSVTNFTRLYFLSAFQEIALVFFSLLTLFAYLKWRKSRRILYLLLSLVFFIISLLSKETAVVLPGILFILDLGIRRVSLRRLVPYFIILLPYLFLRIFVFRTMVGDSYIWDYSPRKIGNTLMWYTLWSFGSPELLVDYIGSGLHIVPKFFTDFPIGTILVILGGLISVVSTFGFLLLSKVKSIGRMGVVGLAFFLLGLLPVMFLPWHKFTLELGLPLVGFSIALSFIIRSSRKIPALIFITIFTLYNIAINQFSLERHYSILRGVISQRVANYFLVRYPVTLPVDFYFEFINDSGNYGKEWGSSKQISQATAGTEMFRVLYKSGNPQVYFEDSPGIRPSGLIRIPISSAIFLR
jgi:hypothetical protein